MWSDVETNRDFLNFTILSGLVSEMILDANGRALSIGISGDWGVGKSSMIRLIEDDLRSKIAKAQSADAARDGIVFVKFNAWLYQGFDDAKAALTEEVTRALKEKANDQASVIQKAEGILKRLDLMRIMQLGGNIAGSIIAGLPVGSLIGAGLSAWEGLTDGDITASDLDAAKDFGKKATLETKGLVRAKVVETPPQMINAIRRDFEDILNSLNVTLVVFVDDLDRCLPSTIIGTLEAMRLLLFMERTAFVIAADERMIKAAVREHFPTASASDEVVLNYFDKLIQVPLRLPPLGTNEIKAYLMMLFVENTIVDANLVETVRTDVNRRLAESWKGQSITPEAVISLIPQCGAELKAELELADRLASQLIGPKRIGGNPRLIKRFLNSLSIRRSLARAQSIPVDDALLAKLLMFEKFVSLASLAAFSDMISMSLDGKPDALRKLEKDVRAGQSLQDIDAPDAWKKDREVIEPWLRLAPELSGFDLRGALHVGRESARIITSDDRLSDAGIAALTDLLALTIEAQPPLKTKMKSLPSPERSLIMTKLLEKASTESSWGTPSILYGLEALAAEDSAQAARVIAFLGGLPAGLLTAGLIVRMRGKSWAAELIGSWKKRTDLPAPITKTLTTKKS